jgi:hypothetical protein
MSIGIRTAIVVSVAVISVLCTHKLHAQDSKITTNLGMGVSVQLNQTANVVGSSVDVVVGVGYNIERHHSVVGQFMWAGLPVSKQAFRPIYVVAGAHDISGSSNLFAGTANYRFSLQGKVFGAYWISGGGLYYRRATLSREVVVGTGTICGPVWSWWGFGCVNGNVSDDQTLVSAGSTALGGNAGMGLTIRINEEGYKFYVESRYHYAPTKNVPTQLMTVTCGFAW